MSSGRKDAEIVRCASCKRGCVESSRTLTRQAHRKASSADKTSALTNKASTTERTTRRRNPWNLDAVGRFARRRRAPSQTPSGTLLDAVQHLARRRPAPSLTPSSTLPDAVQKTAPDLGRRTTSPPRSSTAPAAGTDIYQSSISNPDLCHIVRTICPKCV